MLHILLVSVHQNMLNDIISNVILSQIVFLRILIFGCAMLCH